MRLVGRALYHHQRTPPQLLLQKFICPLKLLGLLCFRLYLVVGECLSNTKINFSAAFLPYLNHLSSLSLPVKIESPLKPEKKKKKIIVLCSKACSSQVKATWGGGVEDKMT